MPCSPNRGCSATCCISEITPHQAWRPLSYLFSRTSRAPNKHTHSQRAELNHTNVNLDQRAAQKQSCTLRLAVQSPVKCLQMHWTLDECLGYCCSDFYRAHPAIASRPFEPLTHFFMDIKR